MKLLLIAAFTASAFAQTWMAQTSGTTASLRGVSVLNAKVVWASGSGGTWLHTSDAGATWQSGTVEGARDLDFRGVVAIDEGSAWLMSSGPGDKSRVYKISSSGLHWRLMFSNPDADGFFDAIRFWDSRHGIIVGDPVGGQFTVFTTEDGGENWIRQRTVPALAKEGAFAASNSCLAIRQPAEAWIGTGGPTACFIQVMAEKRGRLRRRRSGTTEPGRGSFRWRLLIWNTALLWAAITPKTRNRWAILAQLRMAVGAGRPRKPVG